MRPRNIKGFTLIEVIVAVAIFSMSIVGIVSIVATAQRNVMESRLAAKAMFLAEAKMNEAYRVGYVAITEDSNNYVLDETDEENPIEITSEEGEFFTDDFTSYAQSRREEWLKDYYWQVIVKESEELKGMQMVIVRVFNKNLEAPDGENEYTTVDYGLVAELVTYFAATDPSQEEQETDENATQ